MKIELTPDQVEGLVLDELEVYQIMLEDHLVEPLYGPIHSSAPREEERAIKKDIKALKRVIGMYKNG